ACFGENPYVHMTKEKFGRECKICARSFTVFCRCPGVHLCLKKTEVRHTCRKLKDEWTPHLLPLDKRGQECLHRHKKPSLGDLDDHGARQQCAFLQCASRQAGQMATEKTFNKLSVNGCTLSVKRARSQAARGKEGWNHRQGSS
ncbi:Pre-mRNA-splicing factor RBM22, partial [Galemys pyrenaicus]